MNQIRRTSVIFLVFSALFIVSCGRTPKAAIVFKPLSSEQKESALKALTGLSEAPLGKPTDKLQAKSFRLEKLQFKRLKSGKYLPKLNHAKILSPWNRPRVPMLTYIFSAPKGKKARLRLEKPEFEISEQKIEIAKASKPLVWSNKNLNFPEPKAGEYFPGKLFETHQVGNRVTVSVYPMQVETKTGKVLSLTQGNWILQWDKSNEEKPVKIHKPALIVTSEHLVTGAQALQQFHKESLSVESEIITIESIAKSTSPIDEAELPDGYKNPEDFDGIVRKFKPEKATGYDFETAKKIISFLKKRADEDSQFKYVVLLGNSDNIPPSYYFSHKSPEGRVTTGVTDQCYGAGKMCLEPRLAVGRLPFNSNEQVTTYLKKAKRWEKNRDSAENELALYGGRAFKSSPLYIGELGTLVTVNQDSADWKGTRKHFQTEGSFTRADLRSLVTGDEKSSLVYYLDHGLGNRWFAGDEFISSVEILSTAAREDSLPPVVVSIACINAAFDENLMLDRTMDDMGQWGVVSVGTALLRSQGGAIAYLGGARDGLGSPETEVDENGNVEVLGTTHGLQLFDGFVDNYRDSHGKNLGDALIETLQEYSQVQGNDMTEFSHRWTYWITELLGDPLMPVVRNSKRDSGYSPAKSEFNSFESSDGWPQWALEKKEQKPEKFSISKSGGPVTAKIFELLLSDDGFSGEKLLKTEKLPETENTSVLSIDPASDLAPGKQYLIKLINEEGVPRERHVVFSTAKEEK